MGRGVFIIGSVDVSLQKLHIWISCVFLCEQVSHLCSCLVSFFPKKGGVVTETIKINACYVFGFHYQQQNSHF